METAQIACIKPCRKSNRALSPGCPNGPDNGRMNAYRSLLAAALLVAIAMPARASLPGFRPLPPRSAEQHTYLQARELAIGLVGSALPRLSLRDARFADRVLVALRRARFLASTDRRSRQICSSRQFSLFVNVAFRDTIFVCDEVRPHARGASADAVNRLAQGFVHEAVHLAGEVDECVATRFELAVMDRTIGVRSNGSQISYGRECRGRW